MLSIVFKLFSPTADNSGLLMDCPLITFALDILYIVLEYIAGARLQSGLTE